MKTYRDCQSCGMPLARDEKGGGTEVDGSRSTKFCSHCFVLGKFALPDITASQMQDRVREKMAEMQRQIEAFTAAETPNQFPRLPSR